VIYFNNKSEIVDRIIRVVGSYEFDKMYRPDRDIFPSMTINQDTAEKVYQYILDNIEDFVSEFYNYYTGGTDLESVPYGEIEEQLTGIHNHKTGKDYTLPYLRKVFDQAGYYVSGDYAYYNMSSEGLYIDMLAEKIPILVELCKDEK